MSFSQQSTELQDAKPTADEQAAAQDLKPEPETDGLPVAEEVTGAATGAAVAGVGGEGPDDWQMAVDATGEVVSQLADKEDQKTNLKNVRREIIDNCFHTSIYNKRDRGYQLFLKYEAACLSYIDHSIPARASQAGKTTTERGLIGLGVITGSAGVLIFPLLVAGIILGCAGFILRKQSSPLDKKYWEIWQYRICQGNYNHYYTSEDTNYEKFDLQHLASILFTRTDSDNKKVGDGKDSLKAYICHELSNQTQPRSAALVRATKKVVLGFLNEDQRRVLLNEFSNSDEIQQEINDLITAINRERLGPADQGAAVQIAAPATGAGFFGDGAHQLAAEAETEAVAEPEGPQR